MFNPFRRQSQIAPSNQNSERSEFASHRLYNDEDIDEDDDDNSEREPSINRLFGLLGRHKWLTRKVNSFSYVSLKDSANYFLDSANVVSVRLKFDDVMMAFTIISLFINDFQIISLSNGTDKIFSIITSILLLIFLIELIVTTWAKTTFHQIFPRFHTTGYLFSFFWFLDVLATLSFIPDIPLFARRLGYSRVKNETGNYLLLFYTLRIVRLVRFIRIARSYKMSSDRQVRKSKEEDLRELAKMGVIGMEDVDRQLALYNERQSKLGLVLAESITQRVIIIILLMIFIVPLLLFNTQNKANELSARVLQDINGDSSISTTAAQVTISEVVHQLNHAYRDQSVLFLSINPFSSTYLINSERLINYYTKFLFTSVQATDISLDIQYGESVTTSSANTTSVVFSHLRVAQLGAFLNILLTIFVGLVLVIGSYLMIMGANVLIIEPIDRMLNLVEAVAKNPLRHYSFQNKYNEEHTGEYEIQLLQSTISKITSLLRVGFGEAGAGIISVNLTTKHNSTTINPLLPGVRVYAIFGFCDIIKFEDINLRLETDVLTFVNTIAEIVHGKVHSWAGQCNKNLGNAFVVVWRIGDEETLMNILYRSNFNNTANFNGNTLTQERVKNGITPKSRQSFIDDNASTHAMDHHSQHSDGSVASRKGTINSITSGQFRSGSISNGTANNTRSIASLASGVLRGFGGTGSSRLGRGETDSAHNRGSPNPHRGSSVMDALPNEDGNERRKGHTIDLRRVPGVDVLSDKALISYLKIIAEINRSKEVLKYRHEPRLTLNGSEEFKVRMGFGLHAGWAIEGAVGSLQKVDATYLSPHVNLAARLESASRQYGVPLLFSQNFYDILSIHGQEYCRRLDVVTVKGSEIPIGIYTWDTLQEQDFFVEDRKAKRRSSMASLHTIMSNIESVLPSTESELGHGPGPSGSERPGRRISSYGGSYHSQTIVQPRKFSLFSNPMIDQSSREAPITTANLSVLSTAQAALAAAAAVGITMVGHGTNGPPPINTSSSLLGNSGADSSKSAGIQSPSFFPQTGGFNVPVQAPPAKFAPMFFTANDDTMDTFASDYDLLQLRAHIKDDFRVAFKDAVNAYIAGDWSTAKIYFEKANKLLIKAAPMLRGDGPSQTLLEYMSTFNYEAPAGWKGYRSLTDK